MGIRRNSREAAMAFIYQRESLPESRTKEARAFFEHFYSDKTDSRDYFLRLVEGYEKQSKEVDLLVEEAAEHWKLTRMARTDRAVLKIATWELLSEKETPGQVIIDEALEIAKRFGSEESGRFVNGVLDRICHQLRPNEEKSDSSAQEKAL